MRLRSPELLSALSQMCDFAIPFQKHLGFKLIGFDPARIRFDHRADLVGHPVYGRLHGGVISTALDSVGGMAMMLAIADRHPEEPIKACAFLLVLARYPLITYSLPRRTLSRNALLDWAQ